GFSRVGGADPIRGAPSGNRACPARRAFSVATATSVPDQALADVGPVGPFEERTDGVLGLDRVLSHRVIDPFEAASKARHMGVHGDAGDAKRSSQYYVRGFTSDARKGNQVIEPPGNLAPMVM